MLVRCLTITSTAVAAPFVFLGGLVEWARVGTGVHHPIDVLGSDALIALSALIALVVSPVATRIVLPYVPGYVLDLIAAPDEQPARRSS